MVNRFTGSGRPQEGGFLATHKQDFNAHVTGGDWRHKADQVDMNPIITGLGGATVQAAIENLLAIEQSTGTGFVSVGDVDGYGVGSYNVGTPGLPNLRLALNAAFGDDRLQNGGIVLILAGTYTLDAVVEVPAGITIMGEIAGTIINSEVTAQAMFKAKRGTDRPTIGGDFGSGATPLVAGTPTDETRFVNLILVDNLNGTITDSGLIVSSLQTKPMIEVEISSRVVCEGVKFIGRVNDTAGPVSNITGRGKALRGIGTVTSGDVTADALSTHLTVKNCYFDGFQTGIDFSPDNGPLDTLTVDKCRARIFGQEKFPTGIAENSFISLSLCNAQITNNYVLNGGVNLIGMYGFCTLTSGLAADAENVNIVISGNTGESTINGSNVILLDETGSDLAVRAVIVGNNWASALNTGWFITVGDNSTIADGTCGDFNGPGAIDLLMQMNTISTPSRYEHPVTVFVSEGTYTVTFDRDGYSGADRFNFIGQLGDEPTFSLDIAAGASTDEVGNRIFKVGNCIQNINFVAAVGTDVQSVRITNTGITNSTVLVENCTFTDIALTMQQLPGGGPVNVVVRHCKFNQSNTYDDNVSILLPTSESTLLEGCHFSGAGYAGLIGNQTGYSNSRTTVGVTLRDCVFDKTDDTIENSSPLDVGAYLVIDALTGESRVSIDNCQFLANSSTSTSTSDAVIGASLDTEILRFVFVRGREVSINNSIISGPNTTFDVGGTDYPLPALEVIPLHSCNITASRFLSRGLCLKLGGNAAALNTGTATGAFIDQNTFYNGPALQSTTMVDIEINTTLNIQPRVSFTNNRVFCDGATDPSMIPYHPIFAGDDAGGVVNIYAEGCDIYAEGNDIEATITEGGTSAEASLDAMAALVVENTNDSTTSRFCTANISNNRITCLNDHQADDLNYIYTLWVRAVEINVTGNYLQFDNEAGVGSNDYGCLYVENREPSGTAAVAPAVVTGNTFTARPVTGGGTNQLTYFIMIPSGAEGNGMVTNNVFTDPTDISGGEGEPYQDNSGTGLYWSVIRNKNQRVQRYIGAGVGHIGWHSTGAQLYVGGDPAGSTYSQWGDPLDGADRQFFFNYFEDPNQRLFKWIIVLNEVLPEGVAIESVSLDAGPTVSPDAVSIGTLTLITNTGGIDQDIVNPLNSPAAGTTFSLTEDSSPGAGDGDYAYNAHIVGTPGVEQSLIEFRWDVRDTTTGRVLHGDACIVVYRY